MKKKTLLYLKMIAFVVILVILDQISKFVATANLMGKSKYIVIKGLLSFNYLEGGNKGAAWGIFSGKILMFVIITIIAIVIISIFIQNITGIMCNEGKSATLMVLQYTFGMLMAGAVAFIRGITSVLNKVSSKKLLNQSESLFLRANNIIKTSKFYFTRPLGSLRLRRDFCLLIFLLFFCFRLETPSFF